MRRTSAFYLMTKKAAKKRGKKTLKPARQHESKKKTAGQPSLSTRQPFPVVGIGASAGGVEASSELLKFLPADLHMAYVFVHHLSPTYDSKLAQILQRKTSMRVHSVTNKMKIEPDHVYVIPPDKYLTIEDGHLTLRNRMKKDVHAIDYFMNSLASVYQHNAIGILLSGTASDGTIGLKSIKLEGGITFVQDETAKHQQMPTHAMDSGYVDYVLPPQRIAEELSALIRHRYAVSSPNDELARNEKEIKKILSIVLDKYDIDFFSHYKRTTVNRRILRRMALNNIESFELYSRKLRKDNKELDTLYNDFLINVTSFFREPTFYSSLKKNVFPQLIKARKTSDPIRIWIPGCASGEEAYSTAIVISEFLESKKITAPVQIFSTDLDEKAITKARLGLYATTSVAGISSSRLEKYFTKIDGHYQVAKSIRDMCVFSVHNLMKDPPFSRIDLVSCQNVLIYIEAAPQRRILQSFHYALKPTGFLLLGKSETIGSATDLFEATEKDARLYRKKHLSKLSLLDFSSRPQGAAGGLHKLIPEQRTVTDVENEFDKILLTRYVPASVLVNKDMEILRFRGSTAPFFQPASGKASLNLLKMLKEELIFEVRGLFQQAKKTNDIIFKDGITVDSMHQFASIEIIPLKTGKEFYYLIIFKAHAASAQEIKIPKIKKGDQRARIMKLEQALKDARSQLRTTTEDFDVAREELQSANEEIQSSNEELQSINEELETSKEELQSANEELTTINEELQNRLEELKQSHDYVRAIVETMHGPLVVVSGQMRVRTANKAFYEFFKLKAEQTDGRYIYELANGEWDIPALSIHLRDMSPKKISFKNFEITHDFPSVGNRTMLINANLLTNVDKETQILLAFQDITEFRGNEKKLHEAQQQLKLALEGGSVGTWAWDLRTNEIKGSREQAMLFGLDGHFFKTYDEWEKALYPEDVAHIRESVRQSISNRHPLDAEFRITHRNGGVRWLLSKANAYYDDRGQPEIMMGVNIDITERKRAVEALAESEQRFHTLSDQAPVMIWMTDESQNTNFVNKRWLEFTGKSAEQEIGVGWYDGIHPDDKDAFLQIYNNAHRDHKEFQADYRLRRHDGQFRWILAHGVPRYTGSELFIGHIGTCIDINDRIELEKQKDDFMGIASHELKTPVTSIKAYTQILHEKFKKLNDDASAGMLDRLNTQIDKLTGLINTLLDVARVQSGQLELSPEYFEVVPFVNEITEEMQRTTAKHKIDIHLEIGEHVQVFADRARTAQVLNNLVSNAIKYSPDAKRILVKVHPENEHMVFSVQDFGIGIQKDHQHKIFERFYRVGDHAGNKIGGLGLGLYISAQIVRQQGGDIRLSSEHGKGSEFSFSLPVSNHRS
jgi:two-component system, chemotaxis family, CheB/CheR fusion protein